MVLVNMVGVMGYLGFLMLGMGVGVLVIVGLIDGNLVV